MTVSSEWKSAAEWVNREKSFKRRMSQLKTELIRFI